MTERVDSIGRVFEIWLGARTSGRRPTTSLSGPNLRLCAAGARGDIEIMSLGSEHGRGDVRGEIIVRRTVCDSDHAHHLQMGGNE